MPLGLLTGLGAALAWGTMDVVAALASRRTGSLEVTAGIQTVGAVIIVVVAIIVGVAIPTDPTALGLCVLLGFIGGGAYLSYFTGLKAGPIAVVSGMVAAYGGLTVVLSVVLLGETLTLLQAAGAAVATFGVILTGVAFEGGWRSTRFAGPGVAFAIVALVLFSLMAIVTDVSLGYADWQQVLLVSRVVNAALGLTALATVIWYRGRRVEATSRARTTGSNDPAQPPAGRWPLRIVGLILVAGTLDVLGLASFAFGLENAPTWLVGLASSFGPAVTIVIAVAFLGERLKPIQWLGLSGVVVGMIAIAIP